MIIEFIGAVILFLLGIAMMVGLVLSFKYKLYPSMTTGDKADIANHILILIMSIMVIGICMAPLPYLIWFD